MKTFSKTELTKKAIEVFRENTGSVIYATTDGQLFFNKNRAELHAGKGKTKLGVYDIARADVALDPKEVDAVKEDNEQTVDDIKELIAETSDLAELDKLLTDEKEGKDRKTAIAAIEERIAELKEAQNEPKKD